MLAADRSPSPSSPPRLSPRFPEGRLTVLALVNRASVTPWDIADEIASLHL